MITEIDLSYRIDRPAHDPASYNIGLFDCPTEDYFAVPGNDLSPLRQYGETLCESVRYRGRFASRADALQAALDYIGVPCVIVEHDDPAMSCPEITVRSADYRPGEFDTILARRSRHGTFIHV